MLTRVSQNAHSPTTVHSLHSSRNTVPGKPFSSPRGDERDDSSSEALDLVLPDGEVIQAEGNKNADKQSGQNDHFESTGETAEKVGDETGVSKTTSALDARDRVTVGKQGRPSLKRDNVTNNDSEEAERGNSALHQNSRLTQNYKL